MPTEIIFSEREFRSFVECIYIFGHLAGVQEGRKPFPDDISGTFEGSPAEETMNRWISLCAEAGAIEETI